MTIGIDARFFGPKNKGLGRYTQKLIEALEEIDQENQYVVFLRRENFDDYQPRQKNFKKILADYRWYSLAEQIFLPLKICRQKVDLMHFPHFNAPIFYFGKFVMTIHDLILRHFKTRRASTLGPIKYWFKNMVYKIVIWLAIKRAKKIIAVSRYVKDDIVKCFRVRPEKITVIYEGAANRNFQFPISNFQLILNKYKINKPYLLYIGNAYPHKNLERLMKAFEILIEKYKKDLQLVLAGGDDYFYQRLRRDAENYSTDVFARMVFAGFIDDKELAGLYRGASIYVFPSLCEGFGLPPLEAMGCGAPVISSSYTCLPEILGQAALYFNPANPEDMAEKANQVLEDENLRQNLIHRGFEQIKKYSWRKMGRETLEVYKGLGRNFHRPSDSEIS